MMIDRRQFLRGVIATGVAAVGVSALSTTAATASSSSTLGSAESWLLSTGRRALG